MAEKEIKQNEDVWKNLMKRHRNDTLIGMGGVSMLLSIFLVGCFAVPSMILGVIIFISEPSSKD